MIIMKFHDLGKNLVGLMFKGAGFEVIDLGEMSQLKNLFPPVTLPKELEKDF
jgi:methanogenic corrinoid protein MtbC1